MAPVPAFVDVFNAASRAAPTQVTKNKRDVDGLRGIRPSVKGDEIGNNPHARAPREAVRLLLSVPRQRAGWGIRIVTVVPAPGAERIQIRPPNAWAT